MKNIFKYLGIAVLLGGMLVSCAQEKINHPSEAGIPDATAIEPVITVDQETNQVSFELPKGTVGYIPVWLFQDKTGEWTQYAAQNGLKKIFTSSGDYAVRMHLINHNGMSPNYVEKTFHIENSLVNFDKYNSMLTGGESKVWRIDNSVAAHMGCGEPGTNGTNWWSANPDDKKDWGVYDNRMTFALEGNVYTFDPGDAGTIYVNKGITDAPYGDHNTNDDNDYLYPVEAQTSEWKWEVEGDDLYLVLPAKTYFPYYCNMDFVNNPRMKVESMTTKSISLIHDNGAIAWHFILTSSAGEVKFTGFKYNSEYNLWKPVDDNESFEITSTFYAHGGGWEEYPEGSMTYKHEGSKWTINLPYESDQMWQAQFHISATGISLSADKTYDFSCIVTSTTSFEGVEMKVTNKSDSYKLFEQRPAVTAYEDCILWASNVKGEDIAEGDFKLVFDFGGCRENTEITISNIVIKDHANDDGTVLPAPEDPGEVNKPEEYKYDSDSNFWKAADADHSYKYYYAPGWSQIDNPETVQTGNEYKLTLPVATSDQWQCQFFIIPTLNIPVAAANSYDFSVVLNASNDIKGVTVKLTDIASDDNFLFTERVDLTAFEDYILDLSDVKLKAGNDAEGVKMVFDFGGNPDNTEVTIKRIVLKDHAVSDGTHSGSTEPARPEYDADTNLWKPFDASDAHTYSQYYAPGWSPIANPEISCSNGTYSFSLPTATSDQWQCQFFIIPSSDLPVSAAKSYDFSVVLNSSNDIKGATVKVTDTASDENFLFTERYDLTAYEDCIVVLNNVKLSKETDAASIKMVFDFGGNPENTDITISKITLQEHK